jgi:hypothetical protein
MFTAIWKQILDTKYGRRKNRSPRFEKKRKEKKESYQGHWIDAWFILVINDPIYGSFNVSIA